MGDTHTEKDDDIAAEHWDDDGGTSIPRGRRSRHHQDRWDAASDRPGQGDPPSPKTTEDTRAIDHRPG